ncbi:MAG: Molybdopterin oxidoreductase, Psr/Psh family, PsrC-like rane anchor subunit [Bacteroidetes bacterium]|nr:Molybdopterin oxidoreductase, Psr/Psh family, PsrC-like rane anchor subunit [Bacteroidota bacterium]
MNELISTRANPMIDPSFHIWGWEVPVYLFLGGMVAGMMIISGYFLYRGRHHEATCACLQLPIISILLLTLGMGALFLDLEHKKYVWRMYTTFQPGSPMSWGTWILLLVYPALIANMLLAPPPWLVRPVPVLARWQAAVRSRPNILRTIAVANMGLGIALGTYTGILLSAFGARPLWNSLELLILALFLIGLVTSTRVHVASAQLLLSGAFAPAFWVFVVGMGIVLPLFIQSLAVTHRIRHTPVAPLFVIAGGLLLRFVIVNAGQASHWTRLVR